MKERNNDMVSISFGILLIVGIAMFVFIVALIVQLYLKVIHLEDKVNRYIQRKRMDEKPASFSFYDL